MTPLGAPVDPEVYMIQQTSIGNGNFNHQSSPTLSISETNVELLTFLTWCIWGDILLSAYLLKFIETDDFNSISCGFDLVYRFLLLVTRFAIVYDKLDSRTLSHDGRESRQQIGVGENTDDLGLVE